MTASWLNYASVVIAGLSLTVALVLGLRNRGTAKRAFELSLRQERRRDSRVDLHMNESVSWRQPPAGDRLLGFHVLATNPTDQANSLVSAELHVTYSVDRVVTIVKVPYTSAITASPVQPDVDPIALPVRLEANGAVSGWLLFGIRDGLTGGQPIDRYDVVIRDVHDIEEAVQVTLLREVSRDEAD